MKIFFYSKLSQYYGVRVIIDNFVAACNRHEIDCKVIDCLDEVNRTDSIVVSYGVKESLDVIKKGISPKITILTDAISLGYLNKVKFYLKHFNFCHFDFLYSAYGYLRYKREEKIVCEKFGKIALVSPTDIDYLVKCTGQNKDKFIYVANGVNIPKVISEKTTSNGFVLGLLASWSAKQTYQESAWFVKDYFSRYRQTHKDVTLKLIGRGEYISLLKGIEGVDIVGEVESLDDGFSQIDVFVGVNPKGCGVLNRVLDAMSYKTPILSLPECFSGLPGAENLFYNFTDYKSFETQLNVLKKKPEEMVTKANAAFTYIQKNNNWTMNYDKLLSDFGLI